MFSILFVIVWKLKAEGGTAPNHESCYW